MARAGIGDVMSFHENFETIEGVDWQEVSDQVNRIEFSAWTIGVDGSITEKGYTEDTDYLDSSEVDEPGITFNGWEPIRGITGQYGYNGAVMHPSEYIGGVLCRRMAEDGGLFRVEYITELNDDETEDETNLVGWCLLKHVA